MTPQPPRDRAPATATSLWQLKPWWCQPWSIVATGIAIPAISWLLLHWIWLTVGVSLVILGWWWLFLVRVPQAYAREFMASQSATIGRADGS